MYDLTFLSFDLADKYRNPVVILADGVLGQTQESIVERYLQPRFFPPKDWILAGTLGRKFRLIKSLYLQEGETEKHKQMYLLMVMHRGCSRLRNSSGRKSKKFIEKIL